MVHANSFEQWQTALRLDDGVLVTRLLQRGFDPNTVNEKGDPALVAALRDGKWDVARVLVDHPDLKADQPNAHDETALMMASLRGRVDLMVRLLERGAAVRRTGWTPLHYAATGESPDAVSVLLKAGSDVAAPNPAGSAALILAARFGSDEVVKALVAAGANPADRNAGGQTAMDAARWAGREAMAQWLASQVVSKP